VEISWSVSTFRPCIPSSDFLNSMNSHDITRIISLYLSICLSAPQVPVSLVGQRVGRQGPVRAQDGGGVHGQAVRRESRDGRGAGTGSACRFLFRFFVKIFVAATRSQKCQRANCHADVFLCHATAHFPYTHLLISTMSFPLSPLLRRRASSPRCVSSSRTRIRWSSPTPSPRCPRSGMVCGGGVDGSHLPDAWMSDV
jgi:hypothetical protein